MHGFGLLIYPNGGGYQGFFEDGIPRGHGRFLEFDGYAFDGTVDNQGKRNGFGLVVYQNGAKYEGNFENGVYMGRGNF